MSKIVEVASKEIGQGEIPLNTNKTKYATTITSNTATFTGTFNSAPSPLPATSVSNFTYLVSKLTTVSNNTTSLQYLSLLSYPILLQYLSAQSCIQRTLRETEQLNKFVKY